MATAMKFRKKRIGYADGGTTTPYTGGGSNSGGSLGATSISSVISEDNKYKAISPQSTFTSSLDSSQNAQTYANSIKNSGATGANDATQNTVKQAYLDEASGKTTSLAQQQLQSSLAQQESTTSGQLGSVSGLSPALAARQAMQQRSGAESTEASNAAQQRSSETNTALAGAEGTAATQQEQANDLYKTSAGAANQLADTQDTLNQSTANTNAQLVLGTEQVNAGISTANTSANASTTNALLNAGAQAVSSWFSAEGGEVPDIGAYAREIRKYYADGGDVQDDDAQNLDDDDRQALGEADSSVSSGGQSQDASGSNWTSRLKKALKAAQQAYTSGSAGSSQAIQGAANNIWNMHLAGIRYADGGETVDASGSISGSDDDRRDRRTRTATTGTKEKDDAANDPTVITGDLFEDDSGSSTPGSGGAEYETSSGQNGYSPGQAPTTSPAGIHGLGPVAPAQQSAKDVLGKLANGALFAKNPNKAVKALKSLFDPTPEDKALAIYNDPNEVESRAQEAATQAAADAAANPNSDTISSEGAGKSVSPSAPSAAPSASPSAAAAAAADSPGAGTNGAFSDGGRIVDGRDSKWVPGKAKHPDQDTVSNDVVPAMVTPGEHITRRTVAQRPAVKSFLDRLDEDPDQAEAFLKAIRSRDDQPTTGHGALLARQAQLQRELDDIDRQLGGR